MFIILKLQKKLRCFWVSLRKHLHKTDLLKINACLNWLIRLFSSYSFITIICYWCLSWIYVRYAYFLVFELNSIHFSILWKYLIRIFIILFVWFYKVCKSSGLHFLFLVWFNVIETVSHCKTKYMFFDMTTCINMRYFFYFCWFPL